MNSPRRLHQRAFRRVPTSYLPFGALPLAGCGGGAVIIVDGSTTDNFVLSGEVVKGPVENALVFVDFNGDGQLNSGEPSQRTNSDGGFSFTELDGLAPIVALMDETSLDTSAGLFIDGLRLSAPEGSSVISPLTTIMHEGGLTNAEVVAALNLPDVNDVLKCIRSISPRSY